MNNSPIPLAARRGVRGEAENPKSIAKVTTINHKRTNHKFFTIPS